MSQTQIGFRSTNGARIHMTHIISRAERDSFDGTIEELVRLVAPEVVEKLSRVLLRHVARERVDRVNTDGVMVLSLDAVVFTPEELETELMEAYARGMAAVRGGSFNVD